MVIRPWTFVIPITLGLLTGQGCIPAPPAPQLPEPIYNNTTDRTNNNASFLGSAACRACHPDIDATQRLHGHAHMLTRIQGVPPVFPLEAVTAGIPEPPEGFTWADISYVIGGYTRKGRFIDQEGFVLTDGVTGVQTQWNLPYLPNGQPGSRGSYEPGAASPKPYDYSCFVCHTTGPAPLDLDFPRFQENRPGFVGTWAEAGVQCEACHGPGSNHVPNPAARDMYVNTSATFCGECHSRPFAAFDGPILAANGFIRHQEQYQELRASGGHANMDCITCHDPHASVTHDRARAIRSDCTSCHSDQNMALHEGRTFVRGDYVEPLSCESCHMPFATRSATHAGPDVVGPLGRMADLRTHLFRIDTDNVNYLSMFTEDLLQVRTDDQGRAAVTVDFVCIRCHNGTGNAFPVTVRLASTAARGIHQPR